MISQYTVGKRKLLIAGIALLAVLFFATVWYVPNKAEHYNAYCPPGEDVQVMEYRKLREDSYVTVTFIETSGPLEVDIQVQYKESGTDAYTHSNTFTAGLGQGKVTRISRGYDFRVLATSAKGQSGYGTFQVIVSKQVKEK